ncbi:MAG: GGDEF domain-containing protein [Treponema sp.]|nr:GGDEF domain-containing protein [Treponema sp.]
MKIKHILFTVPVIILLVLLLLEYFVQHEGNKRNAFRTDEILINQVEDIILSNRKKEQILKDSLKDDYIGRARAISYILTKNPEIEKDIGELKRISNLLQVDEIHLFDSKGRLYGGTVPAYYGFTFDSGEQMEYFKPILKAPSLVMCQDLLPNTAENKQMMYAICWNEKKDKLVQVGIEPYRLLSELNSNEIKEVVRNAVLVKGVELLIADVETGKILGSSIEDKIGLSVKDIGLELNTFDLNRICRFKNEVDGKTYYSIIRRFDTFAILLMHCSSCADEDMPLLMITTFSYLLIAIIVIIFITQKLSIIILKEQENAKSDPLTSLLNRRAYESVIKELESSKTNESYPSDLVYISMDLNGLKAVNDTYGHSEGDELIIAAAKAMKTAFGNFGSIFRIGGDEFVALIKLEDACLELVKKHFYTYLEKWKGKNGERLSLSCGFVKIKDFPELSILEISRIADKYMYEEKSKYYAKSGNDRRRR